MKKFSLSRLLISLAIFVLIAGVIVFVAVNIGNGNADSVITGLQKAFSGSERAEAFYFEHEPVSICQMNGGLVTASKNGFVIFDKSGDKVVDRDILMAKPAVTANRFTAGIYDCGGNTLFTVDKNGNIKTIEMEKSIVSVSVNKKSWFAVCSEEDNYKSSVTVLNGKGNAVYKLYSGDGYILSAKLSDDNKKLLAIKLTAQGSEIVEYSLNSEDVQLKIDLPSEIAIDCKYGGYGDISVLTDKAFYVFSADGNEKNRYDFTGHKLEGYSLDDGYSVFYCGAYQADTRAYLVTVDDSGEMIDKQEIVRSVFDLDASGQNIAVLFSDGVTIYNKNLQEQKTCQITSGTGEIVMCDDGYAIAVSAYSAEVLG